MILKKLGSRKLMLCVYDVGIFAIISLFFLWFSNIFGKMLVYSEPSLFLINTAIIFTVCMLSRFIFGIYSYILRYVQISVSIRLVLADVAAGVIAVIPCGLIGRSVGVWHTGLVMMAFDIASILARLVYQYIYRQKNISVGNREKSLKAAIVGAGQLGVLLAEDLLCRKDSKYTPVCFMDKDTQKNGKRVLGMNVYPLSDKTKAVLKNLQVDEVFVAMSGAPLVSAKDIAHVRFEGITFEYAYGDGLSIAGTDVQVAGGRVACCGGTGVSLHGDRNVMRGCEVVQVGRAGVSANGDFRLLPNAAILKTCPAFRPLPLARIPSLR